MKYCVCSHPENEHEPNGEIRKHKTPPCTLCRTCNHFVPQSVQGRLYSDAELGALAGAILRAHKWQSNKMKLKEQQKIDRFKRAYNKRKQRLTE